MKYVITRVAVRALAVATTLFSSSAISSEILNLPSDAILGWGNAINGISVAQPNWANAKNVISVALPNWANAMNGISTVQPNDAALGWANAINGISTVQPNDPTLGWAGYDSLMSATDRGVGFDYSPVRK